MITLTQFKYVLIFIKNADFCISTKLSIKKELERPHFQSGISYSHSAVPGLETCLLSRINEITVF